MKGGEEVQVEGLATLAATLEKLVGERAAAERAGSRGVSASWGEVAPLSGLLPPEATQAILTIQWFAREAAELPPSARLEALKCVLASAPAPREGRCDARLPTGGHCFAWHACSSWLRHSCYIFAWSGLSFRGFISVA